MRQSALREFGREYIVAEGPIFVTSSLSDEARTVSNLYYAEILLELRHISEDFTFIARCKGDISLLSSGEKSIAMVLLLCASANFLKHPVKILLNGPQFTISQSNALALEQVLSRSGGYASLWQTDDSGKILPWPTPC